MVVDKKKDGDISGGKDEGDYVGIGDSGNSRGEREEGEMATEAADPKIYIAVKAEGTGGNKVVDLVGEKDVDPAVEGGDIEEDVEVTNTETAREGLVHDLVNEARHLGDVGDFGGLLDEGLHGSHMVELLEVTLVAGAGDHKDGQGVGSAGREACHTMDAVRAEDGKKHVGGGGVPHGLLVVKGEGLNAKGHDAGGKGGLSSAWKA